MTKLRYSKQKILQKNRNSKGFPNKNYEPGGRRRLWLIFVCYGSPSKLKQGLKIECDGD